MKSKIYIACDGDWTAPEVQISGSAKALADLGRLLNNCKTSISLYTQVSENKFYPVIIKTITIVLDQSFGDRLTVTIDEANFGLKGSSSAFNKLGDSLLNIFDENSAIGDHFHLDYYDGNEVLNETNCELSFVCNR